MNMNCLKCWLRRNLDMKYFKWLRWVRDCKKYNLVNIYANKYEFYHDLKFFSEDEEALWEAVNH